MNNDTKNALTDFDLCVALTQRAINTQMKAAWKAWIRSSEIAGTDQEFAWVSIYDNDFKTSGIEVEFDPLTVSLYVPNGKLGQVQVTLHLKSGLVFTEKTGFTRAERRAIDQAVEEMISEAVKNGELASDQVEEDTVFDQYTERYKKEHPEEFRSETQISNWHISFITDLDKKPLDLSVLKQIDPEAGEAAQRCMKQSGLPDSVFSIEYLFMKFTQVDLLLVDNKNILIPDGVPPAASAKARSCLTALLQGNDKFMLGTVVRRNTSSGTSVPTFALTDFIFNVKPETIAPEASTLSYLGMFSGRSLPANINAARIALEDNWVRPEMLDGTKGLISGTMAISRFSFMDRYLIPRIAQELGVQPRQEGLSWIFDLNEETAERKAADVVDRRYKTKADAWFKVTIQPGSNEIIISGRIDGSGDYDSYTWAPIESMKIHEAWFRIAGYQDITAKILLTGEGGTADFKVDVDLVPDDTTQMFGELVVTKNEVGGTAKLTANRFADQLAGFLGTSTVNQTLSEAQKSQYGRFKKVVEDRLKNIDVSLNNNAFIPPGGGVFTFQNLRFSNAGDLLLDVIYKAP